MKKLLKKLIPKIYGTYFNILILFSEKETAKRVFNVFCTVRKGKILPSQRKFIDPLKDKVHSIGDHKIQSYKWQGSKETILLLHGWESNTHRWYKLIEKLQKADFTIVAFDAPAHGYSSGKFLYIPLYADILEHMITYYKPNHLIGHSIGGTTIMFHQYYNPNCDVEKIVTIGSPSEFSEIVTNYQQLMGFNSKVKEVLNDYIFNKFGFKIHELSTSTFAKTNTKKGLLFHDKLDRITPYHNSEKVHASWTGSKFISTSGLGHSMHQDKVNEQIINFLES